MIELTKEEKVKVALSQYDWWVKMSGMLKFNCPEQTASRLLKVAVMADDTKLQKKMDSFLNGDVEFTEADVKKEAEKFRKKINGNS